MLNERKVDAIGLAMFDLMFTVETEYRQLCITKNMAIVAKAFEAYHNYTGVHNRVTRDKPNVFDFSGLNFLTRLRGSDKYTILTNHIIEKANTLSALLREYEVPFIFIDKPSKKNNNYMSLSFKRFMSIEFNISFLERIHGLFLIHHLELNKNNTKKDSDLFDIRKKFLHSIPLLDDAIQRYTHQYLLENISRNTTKQFLDFKDKDLPQLAQMVWEEVFTSVNNRQTYQQMIYWITGIYPPTELAKKISVRDIYFTSDSPVDRIEDGFSVSVNDTGAPVSTTYDLAFNARACRSDTRLAHMTHHELCSEQLNLIFSIRFHKLARRLHSRAKMHDKATIQTVKN